MFSCLAIFSLSTLGHYLVPFLILILIPNFSNKEFIGNPSQFCWVCNHLSFAVLQALEESSFVFKVLSTILKSEFRPGSVVFQLE